MRPEIPEGVALVAMVVFGGRGGDRRLAAGPGGMWVWTPYRRSAPYACSRGGVHERWWHLLRDPGVRRCDEHEVRATADVPFARRRA